MKSIISVLYFLVISLNILAQIPHAINYQAAVRDTNGVLITNQNISLRISIIIDSINGQIIYSEIYTTATNNFGLVNIAVGKGQVLTGNFSDINWLSANHFIKTEVDMNGGSNYAFMGVTQLLSVPYALAARSLILTAPDGGEYELRVDNNGNLITSCSPQPTAADAGIDLINTQGDSVALSANTPIVGQGIWSVATGIGGSFSDLTDPLSLFYGIPGNIYNLVWTITNNCGGSSDTVVISFASQGFTCGDVLTDTRDGYTYNTVQIGSQCWMADNLAYLPSVDPSSWGAVTYPVYYVFDYQGTDVAAAKATSNYQTYGVLYNWSAAMDDTTSSNSVPSGIQGVCPAGWHLPSDEEWKILEGEVDGQYDYPSGQWDINEGYRGSDVAGKLKESGTLHWDSPNMGATNSSGFTALPGGTRNDVGSFYWINQDNYYWTSRQSDPLHAYYRYMDYLHQRSYRGTETKETGYSVRCVKS